MTQGTPCSSQLVFCEQQMERANLTISQLEEQLAKEHEAHATAMNAAYAEIEELRNALDDCHKARSVLRDAMAVLPATWAGALEREESLKTIRDRSLSFDEDRMDVIGPNGNDGLHYQEQT
jgi:hypothetical protein